MAQRTINDEIEDIITSKIQEQPYPTKAKITHTYDNGYTDITTEQYGELKYLPTIGNPETGYDAILFFLDNDYSKRIVVTSTHIPEAEE